MHSMTSLSHSIAKIAALFLSAAALPACAPITALNALTPSGQVSQGVAYGSLPRQKLDVYRPKQSDPEGGWPVVVFFYGGSWNSGERGDYKFIGEALASRGVLTLIADYRLYPDVRYPDFLDDSAQALAYGLRDAARLGGNPKRVFVMGHSAGGYNAAMLALDERWLKQAGQSPQQLAGWVGLAGPYDFLPIENPDAKPVFFHPNYPAGTQPLTHAHAGAPPTFLGAARTDKLVNPHRNTESLAAALQADGVPVTLKLYDHVNHVTLAGSFAWPLHWLAPVLDDVAAFVTTQTPAK
jgi:acetyl esterase/lipase